MLEALRMCEHTSMEQHQAVLKVMMSIKKIPYDEQMKENKGQSKYSIVTTNPMAVADLERTVREVRSNLWHADWTTPTSGHVFSIV